MAQVGDVRLHYLRAGDGPPVVLLHGWPQTSHCWRLVLPALARDHTVVAPDLRGYGRSDKPRSGFDKRTMAADVSALITGLGFDSAVVVGHDRGGRVGHRWGLDRPEQVERLVVLDIIPTREMFRRMDAPVAQAFWHWQFHMQPDLPELLAGANVRGYLEYFFERWTFNRPAFDDAAVDEYVRAFSRPAALRCGFDDYRAQTLDIEHDEADYVAGRRLGMPVLALWGSAGFPARFPTLDVWREYAPDVIGGPVPDCGHFIPEERPDLLLEHLDRFIRTA
jgi:pimeloyl-ACP methyl ester carboxylesterase